MSKSPLKRYAIECSLISLVTIGAIFLVVLFVPSGICFFLSLPIAVIAMRLVRWSANRNLHSILFREMDPLRYKDQILNCKYLRPPEPYLAAWAVCAGEYQTVLDISAKAIAGTTNLTVKRSNLTQMARVYFELGDISALQNIIAQYDAITPTPKKEDLMTFFRYYAAADYQGCLRYCHSRAQAVKKHTQLPIVALNSTLYQAFTLAKLGDAENAKSFFADIESRAPKTNAAAIARQYLATGALPQVLGLTPKAPAEDPDD